MNRSRCRFRWPALLALSLWLGSWSSFAQQDEPFDRTPEDCLSVGRIDRTRALDDQTILFYMRNNRTYRNYLPRNCPGLEQQNRFMYETRGGRLCSIDTITVLEQWGSRIERGFTCRLGEFHPISAEELVDLEELEQLEERGNKRKDGPGADAIEVQPVELPADGGAEAGAPPTGEGDD